MQRARTSDNGSLPRGRAADSLARTVHRTSNVWLALVRETDKKTIPAGCKDRQRRGHADAVQSSLNPAHVLLERALGLSYGTDSGMSSMDGM